MELKTPLLILKKAYVLAKSVKKCKKQIPESEKTLLFVWDIVPNGAQQNENKNNDLTQFNRSDERQFF